MKRQFRHHPRRTIDASPDALSNLFAACCEAAFEIELGVADPPVVDYMADLLLRFLHTDEFRRFRCPTGELLTSVVGLLAEADEREGASRRDLLRHIGDVTLFWTGVYPEALPMVQAAEGADAFLDLPVCGVRSYRAAARCEPESDSPSVLSRIADEYEVCRDGLYRARRTWEELASRN